MPEMTRVEARQRLEAAAFGGPLDQAVTQLETQNAKLLLAAATFKPLAPADAVALGGIVERYERLTALVRAISEARLRGKLVDDLIDDIVSSIPAPVEKAL